MADGFAQASGRPAFVNLHTAPGVGFGMGSLVNAWHNRSPLIVTAGQQVRAMMALEPWLINRQAVDLPKPYVKWSSEPPRAADVPAAIERAYHTALQPPRGPVFVSIPMDDWDEPAEPREPRFVSYRTAPAPDALGEVASLVSAAERVALVAGAGIDRSNGWDSAICFAERTRAAVWAAPASERAGFPQDHPQYQGMLPLAIAPIAERLAAYDLVLVVGAPVFRYYPHVPGPYLHPTTRLVLLTDDPDEAAMAPVGSAVLGDVALALNGLAALVPCSQRLMPPPRPRPAQPPAGEPMAPAFVMATLAGTMPEGTIVVEESASTRAAFYEHVRINRPGSYFATGSGGLGFAVPAAVGIQMAHPERPVVCVVGDGAAMFVIQALWTAARYRAPVVFVVLDNGHYGILKSFASFIGAGDTVPGLDLPGLDVVGLGRGFGCVARRIERSAELAEQIRQAFVEARRDGTPVVLDVVMDAEVQPLLPPPPVANGG
jgi:benzoylformate decarboxylase